MAGNIPGIAVGAGVAGLVLVWSGIKGASVSTVLRDAAHGQNPSTAPNVNPIIDSAGGGATGVSGNTGSEIANDALRFVGHQYIYGGAPGTDGTHGWDCSSFCNWVIGHDNALAIPGYGPGKYTGAVHGPATPQWFVTGLCTTVPRNQAQPGDVVVWLTHMGIVTGPNQMISAQTEATGTRVSSIDGFIKGEPMRIRRLKATAPVHQPGLPVTGTGPRA